MPSDFQHYIQQYCSCMHEWNASYEEYARSVGLSFTSISILSVIHSTENCTQKKISEVCFLPKQTVNGVIRQFYKDGWIRMQEIEEDRRNKSIHFTEKGQLEADRIMKRVRDSERAAMTSLTVEEQQALLSLTRRYITACREALIKA